MTAEEMYNSIPVGSENSISREDLKTLWGMKSERGVRIAISELRQFDNGDNYVIVSFSNGKGYYKTDDPSEIANFKREIISRAKNTFAPLKKANRILLNYENQLEFIPPNNLKAAREEVGLQAKDVVEAIKQKDPTFDKSTMSRIENNKCLPTALQISIMSSLYGKSTGELVGMEVVEV